MQELRGGERYKPKARVKACFQEEKFGSFPEEQEIHFSHLRGHSREKKTTGKASRRDSGFSWSKTLRMLREVEDLDDFDDCRAGVEGPVKAFWEVKTGGQKRMCTE